MLPQFDDVREQIVSMRKKSGLTQAEIAQKSGVSQSFVAKLESGQSTSNYASVVSVYNTLEDLNENGDSTATQLMTSYVVSVAPEDTVRYACSVMRTENYSQLPVIKNGQSLGTVTNQSLVNADPEDTVEEHMETPLPEVPEDTPKTTLSELIRNTDAVLIRRKDDGIIGIVTASDLI